jgi:hypothetical protein
VEKLHLNLLKYINILKAFVGWMLVILATQEVEIRRIEVRIQPRQVIQETLS